MISVVPSAGLTPTRPAEGAGGRQPSQSVEYPDEHTPLVSNNPQAASSLPKSAPARWFAQAPVEPLAVLFLLTNGYTSTLRTQLLYQQVALSLHIDPGAIYGTDDHCATGNRSSELVRLVQENSARWVLYLTICKALFMVLSTLYFGSLSDTIGRRVCLVLPPIGCLLGAAADLVIDHFRLSLPFFFLEVVEYLFGGILVLKLGCSAFIADTVSAEKHSLRMTILDSLSFGSQALSAFFIGRLLTTLSWSFLVVITGNALVLVYAAFLVPASRLVPGGLGQEGQQPVHVQTMVTSDDDSDGVQSTEVTKKTFCHHIFSCIRVYTRQTAGSCAGRRWKLNVLLVAFFISALSATGHVITLYEMKAPLCWNKDTISLFTLEDFLLKSVMMVLVVQLVRKSVADDWLALSGRVSSVLEHVYLAFCIYTPMMFAAPALGCLNLLTEPMTKSLMVALVQPNEQGSLLAVFSLAPVLRMASGAVMAPIYKVTLSVIRGATVFLISACLHCISLLMLAFFIWKRRRNSQSPYVAIS